MRVLRGTEARPPTGAIATIGNYDGLHRGQRAVLDRVVERARSSGAPALVLSFDPHPLRVLDPARAPRRLTTDVQRERLLSQWGIDVLQLLPFTPELAARSAEQFVREELAARMGVRELFVGSRFAFGRGRAGDLSLLRRLGAELGFRAAGVDELELGGAPVSATRIRELLAEGRAEEAAELLGRPYSVLGRVVHGDGRGAELGFPTLNLESENEILPRHGVYVVEAVLEGEVAPARPGVANVGIRPTIGRDERAVVEAHLFDFEESCYGREAEIRFLHHLRGERRFPSLEALRAGIAADVRTAREYFERRDGSHSRTRIPERTPEEPGTEPGNH